jgi:hypothetical protein
VSRPIRAYPGSPKLALVALMMAALACGPATAVAPSSTPTAAPPAPTASPAATNTSAPQPAAKPTQAELPPATFLASGGNLNMRRGPGTGYNILAVLRTGEQGEVTGRSESGDWLLVAIPGQPGSSAWVNGGSQYASVSGDPSGAPVVIVEPPVPAYLRNCLFHPVKIQPGDVLLPNQTAAPDNKVQFNPGIYSAYDQNVEGYPKVFSAELREGKTLDITTDGLKNTYACP